MKWAIAIWLVVTVVAVGASGYLDEWLAGDEAPARDEASARVSAPAFDLVRLDGLPVGLAEHRGKTVILDFWATWCAPCEAQMPILAELWDRRGGEDLFVLGISMDTRPPEEVIEWLAERKLEYPIAMSDMELASDFEVWAFPTLVVVDPTGAVYESHQGVLSRPELDDLLDQIAREFPTPAKG